MQQHAVGPSSSAQQHAAGPLSSMQQHMADPSSSMQQSETKHDPPTDEDTMIDEIHIQDASGRARIRRGPIHAKDVWRLAEGQHDDHNYCWKAKLNSCVQYVVLFP
ncbi:hypothetical protein COCNU_scaffold006566G000050 [Cocos nucifera]|nr:hypothetical protein [Cocos nucifera]